MKILNMVIPILMNFCSFVSQRAVHTPSNEIWRNQWRQTISDSTSQDILSQIFDVIQSDVALHLLVHYEDGIKSNATG